MRRKLKILIYGDVDLNIMDGSAVWLTSMANVLNNDPNIFVDIMLKAPIKNRHLVEDIEGLEQVKIINTYHDFKDLNFSSPNRINVEEAVKLMETLDKDKQYHCIIIRGFSLTAQVLKSHLKKKTIPYITDFTHDKNQISDVERNTLKTIYNEFPYVFVQTPEMKVLLQDMLNVDGQKYQLLLPMIPDYKEEPSFTNENNSLVYVGKFAKGWYTEEILDAFEKLYERDQTISLNIAGDKFQGELIPYKNKITEKMTEHEGINWLGAVSRARANELIREADIGISWRNSEIDHDYSVELSTKLLEYGRLGKPVILRRTKMHENLFGEDYFLFVENEEEFIDKTLEILYNRKLYRKTAKRVYEACKKYTFKAAYHRLRPLLWSFNKDKIKLLFAGHDLKFIKMAIEYFTNDPRFEVKIDKWDGHSKHNEVQSREYLNWADIIFCEWGLGNAVWYSHNKNPGQKLIVRMHLQERETHYPYQFNMDNIDRVIAISPYIFEEFHRVCHIPRHKMTMIYNMIDTQKFNKPKLNESEVKYHLGICGILPSRKRLDRALNILEKLWAKDKNYKLYVKSKLPKEVPWVMERENEKNYYEEIFERINSSPWGKNVIFDEHGDDMHEWFRKIGYILSTSDFESFHLAPMEGMASGAIPLVLHWPGAETIYPQEYIFESEEEIANYIFSSQENLIYGIDTRKRFPQHKFDKKIIISKLEELILSL